VWAAGLAALAAGCSRVPQSPVVARVGDAVLTVDDIFRSIPPEYRERITREQNVNYVKQWIDTELLYQEALKRKMRREKPIRERLARMERDLLSAEMLSRAQLAAADLNISDTMIQEYYDQNRETLTRQSDVVRLLHMALDKQALAQSLKSQATPANFATLAAQHSTQSPDDPLNAPYVEIDELPPAMQGPVRAARVGSVVGPITIDSTFHLLCVVDRQSAGSTATLDEVREMIADRLASHVQKREIERLIEELRLKTNVTYDFNRIPGTRAEVPDSAVAR